MTIKMRLDKIRVGDKYTIGKMVFKVVGIYEWMTAFENTIWVEVLDGELWVSVV